MEQRGDQSGDTRRNEEKNKIRACVIQGKKKTENLGML